MNNEDEITIDFNGMILQTAKTIEAYLNYAINALDDQFGQGFARDHPELVGKMVEAAAADFNTSSFNKIFQKRMKVFADILADLSSNVSNICDKL